jgi:phosphate starvation-inducible protein PhoH and related proteins
MYKPFKNWDYYMAKRKEIEVSHTNGRIDIPTGTGEPFRFKPISAKSENQKRYIKEIKSKDITISIGPAGCGKSAIAVSLGIEAVYKGEYDKLIVSRPVVEAAGERLGFLPGGISDKLDPYIRPIYDLIDEMLPKDDAKKFKADNVEICPLAYMRGRTFKHKFIIVDEAQNATFEQLDMAITRLGEGSKMVITASPGQSDLPNSLQGGIDRVVEIIKHDADFGLAILFKKDIQRHKMVEKFLHLKEEYERPITLEERWKLNNGGYGEAKNSLYE